MADFTNTIQIVMVSYLFINMFVGIGNWFSMEIASVSPDYMIYENSSYISVNASEVSDASDIILANPTLEQSSSIITTVSTILLGIPLFIRSIMLILSFPTGLVSLIYASLVGFTSLMYGYFLYVSVVRFLS